VSRLAIVVFAGLSLFAGAVETESVPPAKARTFALVAAMGNQFTATHEVKRTGSRLPPYRRNALDAPDNILNKLVLAGLDDAVAKADPSIRRVHLGVSVPRPRTDSAPTDELALETAVADVRGMPERSAWDRIIVATPAYHVQKLDGMPERSQGFGLFMQPLCQSLQGACGMFTDNSNASGGETVQTPDGRTIQANQFVAPYVYLKVWILDPQTLQVVDSQEVFDYQKLWYPKSDSMDMSQVIPKRVLAARIVELASHATEEAVKRTELRGTVEVKEKGEVKDPAK